MFSHTEGIAQLNTAIPTNVCGNRSPVTCCFVIGSMALRRFRGFGRIGAPTSPKTRLLVDGPGLSIA